LLAAIEATVIGKPAFVQAVLTNVANSRRQGVAFSESFAQLWKGLAQHFRARLLEVVSAPLSALTANTAEAGHQGVACEVVAGIVRGSKHWPFAEQKALREFMGPLLSKVLIETSLDSTDNWAACLRFIGYDRDPVRLHWLSDDLLA
jgi:proteasome activator subunit 4